MTRPNPTSPTLSVLMWLSPPPPMFSVFNLHSKEKLGSWSEKGDGPSHSPPLSLVSEETGDDHTHPYLSTDSLVTCPQQRHWGHNLTRDDDESHRLACVYSPRTEVVTVPSPTSSIAQLFICMKREIVVAIRGERERERRGGERERALAIHLTTPLFGGSVR